MKLKPSTYFAIALMILMVAVIGKALTFRYYQSALIPVIFGGMVFILAAIQAVREITGKAPEPSENKPKFKEGIEYTKGMGTGVFSAWFFGLALAIYLFGHLIATPLFSLAYVKWRGRSWGKAIACGVCITAFLYVLFPVAFRTELYQGIIPEYLFGD